MFEQAAYKDPQIMEKDLYDYIGRKDWNKILIEDLQEQLEIAFDEAYSFFKFDETIVMDGLNNFVQRFIATTDEFTNGNPLVLKNYNKAKKYLNETPLFLLLKLQNYLIKGNEAQCFNTYKRMLDFPASRPLAIKGLILIANKKSDTELFSNMLNYAKNFNVPLEFFM